MNLMTKILACFVNNLGMAEGIQLIGMFEGKGTGITWSNWTKGLSVDDDFSLFQVMMVLLADNFIYLIMFNYFECLCDCVFFPLISNVCNTHIAPLEQTTFLSLNFIHSGTRIGSALEHNYCQ